MALSQHDTALIRDLKNQPLPLLILYLVVGIIGLAVALTVPFNTPLKVIVAFLSGMLGGLGGEKLVTRQVRRAAMRLLETQGRDT